ncbi:MAG: IS110 family transposase, partial [Proteobacteria bacterium]|nr:IS110 family transposase [Pseudomonadota bacterium]
MHNAAAALHKSQSALGDYFRQLVARLDRAKAITAVARKMARLIYTMLTKGAEYTQTKDRITTRSAIASVL